MIVLSLGAVADCRNDIAASTPAQDFTVHGDGTVTHNTTGLMWMRCGLGKIWESGTCMGSPSTYTWESALVAASQYTYAEYDDWRLPNKNELASIVEKRCFETAINSEIFPETPSEFFWTSSPDSNCSNCVWTSMFLNGETYGWSEQDYTYYVRLVRSGR